MAISSVQLLGKGAGVDYLASNTWVRFADLPTLRRGAAMAAVPKANGTSRLFAIARGLRKEKVTGSGTTVVYTVPVGTVTEYVPGTNRWARRADAPYVWQVGPEAGVLDGKIYLPGGLRGTGELRAATGTMAVYNVATNTWSTVNMPQLMTAQTVWTAGGALYVFGRDLDAERSMASSRTSGVSSPVPARSSSSATSPPRTPGSTCRRPPSRRSKTR